MRNRTRACGRQAWQPKLTIAQADDKTKLAETAACWYMCPPDVHQKPFRKQTEQLEQVSRPMVLSIYRMRVAHALMQPAPHSVQIVVAKEFPHPNIWNQP